MRTVFLSRAEKAVERKILLITCAMSARCDGVRYGTVMFTGLPSGMFMRAAMRWMSRFRTAERAKSLFMRAMCAWRNVVCSCLACCAPPPPHGPRQPLDTKVAVVDMCNTENLIGPFLVQSFGSQTPPPPPLVLMYGGWPPNKPPASPSASLSTPVLRMVRTHASLGRTATERGCSTHTHLITEAPQISWTPAPPRPPLLPRGLKG